LRCFDSNVLSGDKVIPPADLKSLKKFVEEADFINALPLVRGLKPNLITLDETLDVEALRFYCLAAEVLDHAGDPDAGILTRKVGLSSASRLKELVEAPPPENRPLWKQRAWAVLQLGFAFFYRKGKLAEAQNLFALVSSSSSS
jgi:hypothetical protein